MTVCQICRGKTTSKLAKRKNTQKWAETMTLEPHSVPAWSSGAPCVHCLWWCSVCVTRGRSGVCPRGRVTNPCSCHFCESDSDCADGMASSFLRYMHYNFTLVNNNGRVQSRVKVTASQSIGTALHSHHSQ